jgi:hypothetical protein
MVGQPTLMTKDCTGEGLGQPTEARAGNQAVDPRSDYPFRGGFSSRSYGIGARSMAGRDARRLSFCRPTGSRMLGTGTGRLDKLGYWFKLRNLQLRWTASSRSTLGQWSRLKRLRVWLWGRVIGCDSNAAYIQTQAPQRWVEERNMLRVVRGCQHSSKQFTQPRVAFG